MKWAVPIKAENGTVVVGEPVGNVTNGIYLLTIDHDGSGSVTVHEITEEGASE